MTCGVNSPVRSFKAVGGIPHFIARGDVPYIFDEDDNKFLSEQEKIEATETPVNQ